MSATVKSMLLSAENEWRYWGHSVWDVISGKKTVGHTDYEEQFAKYIIANYCSVGGGSPSPIDIQDDRYYWSAVGMSAIMKGAGYSKSEFPFAQSHSVYIRHFVKARINNDSAAAFWGFRLGEKGGQPEIGDIVAYARGKGMSASKASAYFDRTSPYESHSDIVVEKRAAEIDVIGANVLYSVTKKTLRLDAAGHIKDDRHYWFATLKRREV